MAANPVRYLGRSAFSLLELLIVLTIMVGLMAICWPSLSRPLGNSTLQRAGIVVRDALARARQEAARSGHPVVLCLHRDSATLRLESWEPFLLELLGNDSAPRSAGPRDDSATALPDRDSERDGLQHLPDLVYVDEVLNGPPPLGDIPAVSEEGHWFVPFLPAARSHDLTIVLRDKANDRRLGVRLFAATGQVKFVPMPVRPG